MQANAVQTVLCAQCYLLSLSFLFFHGREGVCGAISPSQEGRVCFPYTHYVFTFNERTGPSRPSFSDTHTQTDTHSEYMQCEVLRLYSQVSNTHTRSYELQILNKSLSHSLSISTGIETLLQLGLELSR